MKNVKIESKKIYLVTSIYKIKHTKLYLNEKSSDTVTLSYSTSPEIPHLRRQTGPQRQCPTKIRKLN